MSEVCVADVFEEHAVKIQRLIEEGVNKALSEMSTDEIQSAFFRYAESNKDVGTIPNEESQEVV